MSKVLQSDSEVGLLGNDVEESRSFSHYLRLLRPLGFSLILYIAFFVFNELLIFPWLREVLPCEGCEDSIRTKHAQLRKGIMDATSTTVQCISLPFLGRLIDSKGSRFTATLGCIGIMSFALLILIASFFRSNIIITILILSAAVCQGSSAVFFPSVFATVSRIAPDESTASRLFVLVQGSQIIGAMIAAPSAVGLLFLHPNATTFSFIWAATLFLAALLTLLTHCIFPDFRGSTSSHASLVQSFKILYKNKRLVLLAIWVFLYSFSLTSLFILQAWTMEAWGWSVSNATAFFVSLLALGGAAIAANFCIVTYLGSLKTLLLSVYSFAFGMLLFSSTNEILFIVGAFFVSLSALGSPSFFALAGDSVDTNIQGQTQSLMWVFFMAGFAGGSVLYSTLFAHFGAINIFLIPFGLTVASAIILHALQSIGNYQVPE